MHNNHLFISAFDLDHTLFRKNSSFEFGLFLFYQKYISLSTLLFILGVNLSHKTGFLSIPRVHESAFHHLFLGKSELTVKQWAQRFLKENFDRLIYPPAMLALRKAQEANHLTLILSSSPSFIVEPIAERLGVSLFQATEYAIDKDQRFCHISKLIQGEDKAQFINRLRVQNRDSEKNIMAYSDSHLDLPFLLAADKAIGVNPNKKLRTLCKQNGWSII